jgi:hypothetical protein
MMFGLSSKFFSRPAMLELVTYLAKGAFSVALFPGPWLMETIPKFAGPQDSGLLFAIIV